MLTVVPGDGVGNCVGLVEFAAWRGIDESCKTGEANAWQAISEGIATDAHDARIASHIQNARVEIRRRNVTVVVDEAQIVGHPAASVDPARAGVESLRARAAVERRK